MGSKVPTKPPNDGRSGYVPLLPPPPPPRAGHFNKKTPSQIASEWYTVDEVHRCLLAVAPERVMSEAVPIDVTSREFAEWLTNQYRLAMAKGIQLGRGG